MERHSSEALQALQSTTANWEKISCHSSLTKKLRARSFCHDHTNSLGCWQREGSAWQDGPNRPLVTITTWKQKHLLSTGKELSPSFGRDFLSSPFRSFWSSLISNETASPTSTQDSTGLKRDSSTPNPPTAPGAARQEHSALGVTRPPHSPFMSLWSAPEYGAPLPLHTHSDRRHPAEITPRGSSCVQDTRITPETHV